MRVAVLFSGGKDSCYTIMRSIEQNLDVELLLTLSPRSDDSWLFHHPCIQWTSLQAEAMGLPIVTRNIEAEGEAERDELEKQLTDIKSHFNIEGIVAGTIASQYQKKRIVETARSLRLECITPLWGREPLGLLRDQIESGLNVIIAAVSALGLDHKWLGKRLDKEAVEELDRLKTKHGLNPSGEGGEYETFVLDGPLFRKKIVIQKYHKTWDGERGHLEIEVAKLGNKKQA